MVDLKGHQQKNKKVRRNRSKQKRRQIDLRKLMRRTLRIGVALFSGVLLVVGSFLLVQLLLASDLFRIDQISVAGNTRLSGEQTVALSDIERGVNTFNLDLDLIGRKIEENPWVLEARVQRIFPRQVRISLIERRPVAIINLGYLYYLDEGGEVFKVLDANDSLDYPVITGFDYERAKGHDTEYVRMLRQIVALVGELKSRQVLNLEQISEIHRTPTNGLTLFTAQGGVEIKMGWEDFGKKLNRLERIYAKLQPKLQILDYIDLNVDEKVIVRIERPNKTAKS